MKFKMNELMINGFAELINEEKVGNDKKHNFDDEVLGCFSCTSNSNCKCSCTGCTGCTTCSCTCSGCSCSDCSGCTICSPMTN